MRLSVLCTCRYQCYGNVISTRMLSVLCMYVYLYVIMGSVCMMMYVCVYEYVKAECYVQDRVCIVCYIKSINRIHVYEMI